MLEFSIIETTYLSEDVQEMPEMQKKPEQNGSQSVKADPGVLSVKQQQERRFRDVLEDDEVREMLKFLHARDEERAREKR